MPKTNDLTGQVFGRLTVLAKAEPYVELRSGRESPRWLCLCSCGRTKAIRQACLTSGRTKSCGCLARENLAQAREKSQNHRKDLTGQTIGELTVLREAEPKRASNGNGRIKRYWLCKCGVCGKEVVVSQYSLLYRDKETCSFECTMKLKGQKWKSE